MLKLTKTIVNENRSLIGFVIKGKEKEFGGFSDMEMERGVPMSQLTKEKFSNNQIAVVKGKIVEKGNFKINSLPMCIFENDNYIDLDNHIYLVGRFVQNNENIGFRVKFANGSEESLKYANVILICKWFKPGNFAIRTSGTGKQYICGKSGSMKLEDLPVTVLGDEPKKQPKRMKSAAKEFDTKINTAVESGYDILDIYGFIRECNGCIIKLPNEDYTAASAGGAETAEGFTSLGIGEVANPTPLFNATKLNVNAGFKKVGIVPVNINGTMQNITTFTYRTKSLFLNGDNYIKKFGIAVPTEKEAELIRILGASLALEKITDNSITAPLGQVIDAKSLSFYKVDSSKIDLISENKRKESILSSKQLVSVCKQMYELKLISKAMGPKGGLMKELKAALGDAAVAEAKGKKPFGIFSMMNTEALQAISEAGIDIYSGAYKAVDSYTHKPSGAAGETAEQVEIEYTLKGYDASKLTGSKIIQFVKANDTTQLPESIIKYVREVLAITDLSNQYKAASQLYEATEKKVEELSKKLWMHNASMYLAGNKARIHTHDAKSWIPDTTTKVKKATVFTCTNKGAEGLTVKFTGVTI